MSNQWKMVPVEPTPEMYAAASTDSREQGMLGAGYKAMLAAAPVSPAGDVEVLGYRYLEKTKEGYAYKPDFSEKKWLIPEGFQETELVDRAHVTRLTAERDDLQGKIGRLENTREQLSGVVCRFMEQQAVMQSELTKAREFISDAWKWLPLWLRVSYSNRESAPATPIARNVDESCGQDAEAAKGGE